MAGILTALIASLGLFIAQPALAQSGRVEVTDMTTSYPEESEKVVPERTEEVWHTEPVDTLAQKYMGVSNGSASRSPAAAGGTSAAHYLAIHVGTYVSDDAYKWGRERRFRKPGKFNAGVTYRMGEWVNSMDLALRMDFSTYSLAAGDATKISVVPIILFPDSASRFPLYFGGGVGAGIVAKQIDGESSLTLEYQLLLGARFFEVVESTGFFVEAGIKNHVHLLSDGQYNGTFIAAGAVFTF